MGTIRTLSTTWGCWRVDVSPRRARLHLGPPLGRDKRPHHVDDAAHLGHHVDFVSTTADGCSPL
jgi:hypothetical protein